ncbi:hypothetical protein CY34DRAFT_41349, partial [Suillus luteus UH-Slu-Lm8-n1]
KGGKNILNLRDRNEAIELKWLKGLLTLNPEKPPWEFFAHTIIAKVAQHAPVVKPNVKINSFLQTWGPSHKRLPTHLKHIFKVAKKYNVRWKTVSIDPEVACQLPIWFHLGASDNIKKLNNHLQAGCLRDNHKVNSINNVERMLLRQDPTHQKHKNCTCNSCTGDRLIHCRNPSKCMLLAKDLLTCVLLKWNPATCATPYTLHIDPEQIPKNGSADDKNAPVVFDPVFPSPKTLEEGFRVFVAQRPQSTHSARQIITPPGPHLRLANITTADAHLISKDGEHTSAGTAWFRNENPWNISIKLPDELAGPGAGEIGVLITAISSLPANTPLHIHTKSLKLRKDLTINLARLEDTNWIAHPNSNMMRALVVKLRMRPALTTLSRWDEDT